MTPPLLDDSALPSAIVTVTVIRHGGAGRLTQTFSASEPALWPTPYDAGRAAEIALLRAITQTTPLCTSKPRPVRSPMHAERINVAPAKGHARPELMEVLS